ncbi:DUF4233 domain-containing protein [Nocardioides sp. ChNu-153]|uniref:DUF4233 domain-containing protein n=1 Tax=Nocardioides sp. ChNu-153 TaxID=2779364 RepID=UPI00265999E6|nr:DUF4233 domain-containing protein [Nocardioides sp. ChNu-153]
MSVAPEEGPRLVPAGAPDDPERHKSPRRGMCAAVLFLEAIALALTVPVIIRVSDVDPAVAVAVGGGLALACLVVSGLLRRPWGYTVGWVLQVGAVGLAVLVPAMLFLGGLFAGLWATADLLGRKIDRERGAAWQQYDAADGA